MHVQPILSVWVGYMCKLVICVKTAPMNPQPAPAQPTEFAAPAPTSPPPIPTTLEWAPPPPTAPGFATTATPMWVAAVCHAPTSQPTPTTAGQAPLPLTAPGFAMMATN